MPAPRISQLAAAAVDRRKELSQPMAGPEVLGTIPADSTLTDPTPQGSSAAWQTDTGLKGPQTVEMTEPPPPWEVAGGDFDLSDASKFVRAPDNVTMRWINPKLLDSFGWRHWQPVSSSDPRFKVLVDTMVAPDGLIRRGGATGDILAWMYTSWVRSAREVLRKKTEAISASAVDKQEELRAEFNRGTFGPNVRLEEARHPSHTNLEGRTIKD